jgi:phosphate transport system protein
MAIRQHFIEQLEDLNQDILKMSTLVEEAIQKAISAFENKDTAAARKVIDGDIEINTLQADIEDKCTVLIATEQPVATDLRRIVAIIKVVSNLERIGDHSVHLARATVKFVDEPYIDRVAGIIPRMADIGITMIRDAIDSFVNRDLDKAKKTADLDEKIDELHRSLFTTLITTMKENTQTIEQAAEFLFINRFMERLGDHVTNMCEWVVFAITGEHIELNR